MYKIVTLSLIWLSTSAFGFQSSHDPTRPLSNQGNKGFAKVASSGLVLQSIIKNSQGQTVKAIISGQLVAVGDSVSIYKVKSITDGKAVLSSPDTERTLKLFSQAVVNYK